VNTLVGADAQRIAEAIRNPPVKPTAGDVYGDGRAGCAIARILAES